MKDYSQEEWFIPWLHNCLKNFGNNVHGTYSLETKLASSTKRTIINVFIWQETPEGINYWTNINNIYRNKDTYYTIKEIYDYFQSFKDKYPELYIYKGK